MGLLDIFKRGEVVVSPPSNKKQDSINQLSTPYGLFGNGGIANNMSGMGGPTDKSTGSFYVPLVFNSSQVLQTIYNQSWAARKFIDIPVDDQFILGRTFESEDTEEVEKIEKFIDDFSIDKKLADGQKAGRLYGDAIVWFVTKESPPQTPINVDRLKPGDLVNILVIDRYDISHLELQQDPAQPNYLKPMWYNVNLPYGKGARVHHSRVIRFQGKTPLTTRGYQNYGEQWFGISELTDMMSTITSDDTLEKAIAHLVNEASIPVVKLKELNDALCSAGGKTEDMDLNMRLQHESMMKSLFRTTYLDSEDDFTRDNLTFSGLPDLMDRFAMRLSAAADIPRTRFLGASPQGLNSTGDSDMKNYAVSVQSRQMKNMKPAYAKLDPILAPLIGVDEIPPYEFPSLIDADEQAQANTLMSLISGLSNAVMSGIITEIEARDVLRKNQLFAALEEQDPEEALNILAGIGEGAPIQQSQSEVSQSVGVNSEGQSLNGAQIQAAVQITTQVAEGTLPPESGKALLTATLPISEEQAQSIIQTSGEAGQERVSAENDNTETN